MQETLIWALMLLTEAFLLSSGILGFLLWRARKVQRRLRAELAELQRVSQPARDVAQVHAPVPAPAVLSPGLSTDTDLAEMAEIQPNLDDLNQVIAVLDDSSMDESMERLEETNKTLEHLMEALQTERTLAQQDQHRATALRQTVQKMGEELETLRYGHKRIQRDLQNKKLILKRTMDESDQLYKQRVSLQYTVKELRAANARLSGDVEVKDRLLKQLKAEGHTQQNLRGEVWTLKSKLTAREADVERLQTERDALAEEYSSLSKEYERIYANFMK